VKAFLPTFGLALLCAAAVAPARAAGETHIYNASKATLIITAYQHEETTSFEDVRAAIRLQEGSEQGMPLSIFNPLCGTLVVPPGEIAVLSLNEKPKEAHVSFYLLRKAKLQHSAVVKYSVPPGAAEPALVMKPGRVAPRGMDILQVTATVLMVR
jgi:hypothetical protein